MRRERKRREARTLSQRGQRTQHVFHLPTRQNQKGAQIAAGGGGDSNITLPLPVTSGGTGVTAAPMIGVITAADAAAARAALGVGAGAAHDAVTLVGQNYLTLSQGGQEITAAVVPVASGGTGATTAAAARTALDVDVAGTDNSTDVTLANNDYLSLQGQTLTGGTVPVASGGTGATDAAAARTALNVDVAGTDNSTDVTLAGENYLTLSQGGQEITAAVVPVASGGTGATDAAAARTALGAAGALNELSDASTQGTSNVFLGSDAGLNNQGGTHNTAAGEDALKANVTSQYNAAFGFEALLNATGGNNTGVGSSVMAQATSGSENVAMGTSALYRNEANKNTAIGFHALHENAAGEKNTALGSAAGYDNVSGDSNVFIGFNAGKNFDASSNKLYIANSDTQNLITGDFVTGELTLGGGGSNPTNAITLPIGIGTANQVLETDGAGQLSWVTPAGGGATDLDGLSDASTQGTANVFLGLDAGLNNQGGTHNTAAGEDALKANVTSQYNAAFGFEALLNATGGNNTGVGSSVMAQATSGSENVAMGTSALYRNEANKNTAIGFHALHENAAGEKNTALGSAAGYDNVSGDSNVFIGFNAGKNFDASSNKLYIANSDTQNLITGDFTDDAATPLDGSAGMLNLHAIAIFMPHLPEVLQGNGGLASGRLYKDGSGYLKIA